MRRLIVILLSLTSLSSTPALGHPELLSPHADVWSLRYDKHYSPWVGSDIWHLGLKAYEIMDDVWFSSTIGQQAYWVYAGRLLKLFALEYPLASWASLAQHEVFGHGARARMFGVSQISYSVHPFSGVTEFPGLFYQNLAFNEKTVFVTGGIEGTTILAEETRNKILLKDRHLDCREALLYLTSTFDQTRYVLNTTEQSSTIAGHDIDQYISLVNTWHGSTALTLERLKRRIHADLFDPLFYQALYSLSNYLLTGHQSTPYYLVKVSENFHYLPIFRTILAPWGPEIELKNYFKHRYLHQLYQLDAKYGNTGGVRSVGIAAKLAPIWQWGDHRINAKCALWHQPHLLTASITEVNGKKIGGAIFAEWLYAIDTSFGITGELGYKTSGYLVGEPLQETFIGRLGIRLMLKGLS